MPAPGWVSRNSTRLTQAWHTRAGIRVRAQTFCPPSAAATTARRHCSQRQIRPIRAQRPPVRIIAGLSRVPPMLVLTYTALAWLVLISTPRRDVLGIRGNHDECFRDRSRACCRELPYALSRLVVSGLFLREPRLVGRPRLCGAVRRKLPAGDVRGSGLAGPRGVYATGARFLVSRPPDVPGPAVSGPLSGTTRSLWRSREGVPREGQPRGGPEPAGEEFVPRETGFFQRAAASAPCKGPRASLGLRLGAFTIPELTLRMPSLELPSVVRSREAARMRVSAADAPWVSTGFENVRVGPAVAGATRTQDRAAGDRGEADSKSRSAPAPDCEDVKREYEAKLRELQSKIDDCEKLRRCIEDCLKTYPQAALQNSRPYDDPLLGEGQRRVAPGPDHPLPLPASAPSYDLRGSRSGIAARQLHDPLPARSRSTTPAVHPVAVRGATAAYALTCTQPNGPSGTGLPAQLPAEGQVLATVRDLHEGQVAELLPVVSGGRREVG